MLISLLASSSSGLPDNPPFWCFKILFNFSLFLAVVFETIIAIIVSNTTAKNREKLNNILKHQKGGLSGKPLEEEANKLISKFYKLLKGKIEIIGVGGVDSGESAYKKFQAGASYVQLYTGMVFQGPNVVGKIKKELKEILIDEGIKNFKEIIGKKLTNWS